MTRTNQAFILCWVTINSFYIQKHSSEGIDILYHRDVCLNILALMKCMLTDQICVC
jgi:hypothetical protein